jgi:hypothetical protein
LLGSKAFKGGSFAGRQRDNECLCEKRGTFRDGNELEVDRVRAVATVNNNDGDIRSQRQDRILPTFAIKLANIVVFEIEV